MSFGADLRGADQVRCEHRRQRSLRARLGVAAVTDRKPIAPPRKSVIAALTIGVSIALGLIRAVDLYWRRGPADVGASRHEPVVILADYLRGMFSAGDSSLRQLRCTASASADRRPPTPSGRRASRRRAPACRRRLDLTVTDADGIIRHSTQPAIVGQSRADQFVFRQLATTEPRRSSSIDTPYLVGAEPQHYSDSARRAG